MDFVLKPRKAPSYSSWLRSGLVHGHGFLLCQRPYRQVARTSRCSPGVPTRDARNLTVRPGLAETSAHERKDGQAYKAREVVLRLHALPGDEDTEFARSEFYQIQRQAVFDRALSVSWLGMFTKKSYRT